MACGDEANDLSMIEWVGLGVTMQNAVPAVKAVANVITPNDQRRGSRCLGYRRIHVKGELEYGIIWRLFGKRRAEKSKIL